jgi:hypothetical protein
MHHASRLAFFSIALTLPLSAEDSLRYARQAQLLLGSASWSQVVRIENTAQSSIYPRSFHALIFELDKILWIYTPVNGTQSLSQYRGRVSQDKEELGLLLKFIEAGFAGWTPVVDGGPETENRGPLPNGCFLESVALLRRLAASATQIQHANLLSYYVPIAGGWHGHTVLQVQTSAGWQIIDASGPRRVLRIRPTVEGNAMAVARQIRRDVANARTISLAEFATGGLAVNGPSHPVASELNSRRT